jgi:excisionase family DNA binding protein
VARGRTATVVPALPARLLSVEDLAELLQVPMRTIYDWRYRGDGPKPIRVGRHLRFDPADVARWLAGRKEASVNGYGPRF